MATREFSGFPADQIRYWFNGQEISQEQYEEHKEQFGCNTADLLFPKDYTNYAGNERVLLPDDTELILSRVK